jgi:hypothetical protein
MNGKITATFCSSVLKHATEKQLREIEHSLTRWWGEKTQPVNEHFDILTTVLLSFPSIPVVLSDFDGMATFSSTLVFFRSDSVVLCLITEQDSP